MLCARLVTLAAVGVLVSAASANLAPPRRPDPKPEPPPVRVEPVGNRLVVVPTPGATEAKLTIPRKMLDNKPAKEAAKPDAKKADAGLAPGRTVVAGVALFAAISLAGLQLIRRRGGSRLMMVTLLVAGGGLAVIAADALGNGAPFPRPDRPDPFARPPIEPAIPGVAVVVEVVDDGDVIKLAIDPAHLNGNALPPAAGAGAPPFPGNDAPVSSPPGAAPQFPPTPDLPGTPGLPPTPDPRPTEPAPLPRN